jgi:hypothetical protein
VSWSFPDSFATFPRSNGSLEKPCLHIYPVVLLSSDEVGHPRPRDVRHHEALCLLYPRTLPLSHAILHVRRTVLPLDVLVRKRLIWGYLQSVLVSLQNCPLPLQVTSLICSHPRCLLFWTRVFLRRRIFTILISGEDFSHAVSPCSPHRCVFLPSAPAVGVILSHDIGTLNHTTPASSTFAFGAQSGPLTDMPHDRIHTLPSKSRIDEVVGTLRDTEETKDSL